MEKTLRRSRDDAALAGVCAGVAAYFGWDKTRLRVVWLLMALFAGWGALLYIALWLVMPKAD